jgi:hypothetical protein
MFLRNRATPLKFRRTPSWLLAQHPPEEAAATLNQTKDLVLRSSSRTLGQLGSLLPVE